MTSNAGLRKDIIIGAISGYGWSEIEPFFVSWKKNCPEIDCVMFCDGVSRWTTTHMERMGVVVMPFNTGGYSDFTAGLRWGLYYDYLNRNKDSIANVFMTDVRDVVFQSNCFSKHHTEDEAYFGYAIEEKRICECFVNTEWIRRSFGEQIYEELKDYSIICCGTVWGTIDEVLKFCQKMNEMINTTPYVWGTDQATMNYIIHKGILSFEIVEESCNDNGNVYTAALATNVHIKGDQVACNSLTVPAVVHQYERKSEMKALVDKLYREEQIGFSDLTDEKSVEDILYYLLDREERKGTVGRIVKRYRTDRAADCFTWFIFPWEKVKPHSYIIIYGGGKVGKAFCRQIEYTGYVHIAAICDKEPENVKWAFCPVLSVEELECFDMSFIESIVVAIESERIANEIKKDLVERGFGDEMIVWQNPKRSLRASLKPIVGE